MQDSLENVVKENYCWTGSVMFNLINTISKDLSIKPFWGETTSDYYYRVCYSALSLALLYSARSVEAGKMGISKKAQTDRIQRLLAEYETKLHLDNRRFTNETSSFITQCRRVYEETGFLTTDDRNYDVIALYGRTIPVGSGHLYFGIPIEITYALGQGFYTNMPYNESDLFETFRRDTLTSGEYIERMFDPLDFVYRDIDLGTLEFFNPHLRKSPSASWNADIQTNRTVARDKIYKTMYRVIREADGGILFADLDAITDKECLNSYETRRLLFALKEQAGEPVVAWVNQIDNLYYEIRLSAQLPTKEYYFLLLCSWPKNNAFERNYFITTKNVLPTIETVFRNIGISIR